MPNDLLNEFRKYDKRQKKRAEEIPGLLGYPTSQRIVEVPGRNGYVYVRLRSSQSEIIQARNEKVSPVWGLPVLVEYRNGHYNVIGIEEGRYKDWGSYTSFLPKHGAQHSLSFENGGGGDITWVYSRQFLPMAVIPSGTNGSSSVYVWPHNYRNPSDASWNVVGGYHSINLLPAKPTDGNARMLLLYWDLESASLAIISGTTFASNITGTIDVLPYTPTLDSYQKIPLAGIRLVSGTSSIGWNNIYDMRQFQTSSPAPFAGGFAAQDEGIALGTGTTINFIGDNVSASVSGSVIRVFVTGSFATQYPGIISQDEGAPIGSGTVLNVTGNRATFSRSGTVLNLNISPDPQELIGFYAYNEGVPLGTGTIIDFVGENVDVSLSGTVLRVFVTGSTGGSANPPISGSIVIFDGSTLGSALTIDFGDNLTASVSGTVAKVDVVNVPAPVNTNGMIVWDEGAPLGTGSTLNFTGAGVTATISGSVVNVDIPTAGASTTTGSVSVSRKTADEFRTSTTPADDGELKLVVGASQIWEFKALILYRGSALSTDFKTGFSIPTGTLIYWGGFVGGGAAPDPGSLSANPSAETPGAIATGSVQPIFATKAAGIVGLPIGGVIQVASTPGTVNFQWSPNSGLSGVTVLANSYFIWTRLV